jgi:hypothetical protein
MPLEAARERLDQLIAKEGDAVLAGSKRGATAIGVEAGTGKTRRAHLEVVRVVRALREKGDTRCVVIATPRHDLNDEQAKRIQAIAADIDVRVFRGANAPDPTNPEMTMCRQVDAHNAAVSRKLEPKKTVCPVCPFRAGCAYREQARSRADVWIVPHSLLFLPKPAPIGIPAWVIVDENPISAALFGTGVDPGKNAVNGPLTLSLDTLCRRDTVRGSPIETDRLMDIRTRLRRALEASANGRMTRSALIAEGLTADDFAEAIKLEYKTGIRPALGCALSLSERLETLKAADANRDLERRVILMREAGRLLRQNIYRESGRISVGSISSEDGSVRVVRMKGLRRITEEWRVRTMVIDATLQENLLRSLWWNITVKRMGPVAAPHRHIAQVIDRAFSLAMLDAGAPR